MGIIKVRDAIQQLKLSKSTIYAKLREGDPQYDPTFPRLVKLGARAVGFRESDLEQWLASR